MADSEHRPAFDAGEQWADIYDERWAALPADDAAECLSALSPDGTALELGIGTGRVALPLAQRGIQVSGIDASEAMVAKLRAKPGGAAIPVTIGDFVERPLGGQFGLIYVVFNTFFDLLTQEAQVRCVANVADHLAQDGVFVIEAFVPDPARFTDGQTVRALRVETDAVDIEATVHDAVNQRIRSQHVLATAAGIRLYPVELRYAWPSELDLMARLAGLRLRERWGGWRGEPFTARSTSHVSVYERG